MPAAFGPTISCGPGPNAASSCGTNGGRERPAIEDRVGREAERSGVHRARRRHGQPGSGGRPERHDDVDVAVVADRLEDARRERPVQLEGELVRVDVRQDVRQEAGVERDRRPVALDRRLDPADVVADLGVRADGDPAVAVEPDAELDDVRRLVGDQGRRPDGPEELLAIEDGPRRVARRQDRLVVRVLAVDQAGDEIDPVDVEQELVPRVGEDDRDRARRCRTGPGRARGGRGPG